ncbi:MAG: Asp-tRNA(Asn)/Glu-tRNA(Gln) amidotransferase subunit GatB [Oscillospiraceae bacterium]|nr:Asp-tRNA(Asn)/Glu-tRNA(Gln) amidotransferase subunit GatB [Oscillospiraceae bacterium]
MIRGYEVVVGLEVHAELNTATKIYCNCKNSFGLEVNTQVCPICLGMPGTLPTLNEKVVEYAIKMGHALNCGINRICKQDRKNYFYPDLPKSYQISQADIPLCHDGYLDIIVDGETKRIGVERIHIEEDAGKLLHSDKFDGSLVDFNRCGVPLIEIVSRPDMRSSDEAKAYLETIRSILRYIDISDCKMQEGSIRCDVNVSVHKPGEPLGTRCEMKNVNSFSAVVHGIDYEANRQIEVLEAGGTITQKTRRWDDAKGESVSMRSKEDAQDYRYFPEPDLGTIVVSEEKVQYLKDTLPELPNARIMRYIDTCGLSYNDAAMIVDVPEKAELFDKTLEADCKSGKLLSNWILGEISKLMNDGTDIHETNLTPEKLAKIVNYIDSGKISTAAGKKVFDAVMSDDADIDEFIEKNSLSQISDVSSLEKIAAEVVFQNEKSVSDYKSGKTNALGYLVGQCMKASKGKANPAVMKELVLKLLEE